MPLQLVVRVADVSWFDPSRCTEVPPTEAVHPPGSPAGAPTVVVARTRWFEGTARTNRALMPSDDVDSDVILEPAHSSGAAETGGWTASTSTAAPKATLSPRLMRLRSQWVRRHW